MSEVSVPPVDLGSDLRSDIVSDLGSDLSYAALIGFEVEVEVR